MGWRRREEVRGLEGEKQEVDRGLSMKGIRKAGGGRRKRRWNAYGRRV